MKYTYFTDIEEVVQWTYDNDNLFYDKNKGRDADGLLSSGTADNIRKLYTYPDKILEYAGFEQINIIDLLLCINNAQDNTRPSADSKFLHMTSTSKKVMIILLLGRVIDGDDDDGSFVILKNKANDQFKDTHQILYEYFDKKYNLSNRPRGGIETIRYFPGRTVSYAQILNATKKFKNSIKDEGVQGGLDKLVEYGLVKKVGESGILYKLDFQECKKYLESCYKE